MKDFLDENVALENARKIVADLPLADLDVSNWDLFQDNTVHAYFERLRRDDPVHYQEKSKVGKPFWSITKFEDIKFVDTNSEIFSSEPTVVLTGSDSYDIPSFLNMDEGHDAQRRVVAPIVSPTNLANLEGVIRERAASILDGLPVGEEFDWVKRVSIDLTSQMLATLLNFPLENRRQLIRWSDIFSLGVDENGKPFTAEETKAETMACLEYFTKLRDQRAKEPLTHDLVSMLAHGEATKGLQGVALLANVMLLIIGGNDTTRNSISGSVVAMNMFSSEFDKLKADHSLVKSMVPEIVRWQTPLAHMQRRAKVDVELGGKKIAKDDLVVMWYLSGNRDEDKFESGNDFIIDRANARNHVAFGYGIHRCLGNRLAEMQLRVLWEEILKRFKDVEVVGKPERTKSTFIRGYSSLPVILHK